MDDVERWERVKELFAEALEREEAERAPFLLRACPNDAELRREVESLLSGERKAGDFLKGPAARLPAEDSTRDHPPTTFSPGQTVSGRFQVLRFIGHGGMGEVYEARDLELGARVALKTIRPEIASDPRTMARFKQEIQLAQRVTHPNVCRIFDLQHHHLPPEKDSAAGEVTFLTMELLPGETLAARLGRVGRIPPAEAFPLARQMAAALAAAHDVGVIHRDFKPGNVMLVPAKSGGGAERAVVTDFGLAKAVAPADHTSGEGPASATGTGHILGTLAYMSPEQLQGREATPASDIFALGLVMYEMIAGRRPFADHAPGGGGGRPLAPSPSSLRAETPDLDPRWEQVILRCLQMDPPSRYASAREVAGELTPMGQPGSTASENVERADHGGVGSWFATRTRVLLAILALLLALAAARFIHRPGGAHQINSLAVLPLENLSGKSDQDYFADGMTDELITHLAQISSLRVTSRTSVMRFKGVSEPMPQIARELNVDAIIEGSVLRAGDRVRISAQLIDPATDRHIWAQTYERDFGDVLALQSEVARAIAQEIKVKLTPQEQTRLAESPHVNAAAYELYLRGRYYWNQRTPDGLQKGLEYFKQAIAEDPGYALGYSGLADSYLSLGDLGVLESNVAVPDAKAAAEKALELDDNLAEAHASLGLASLGDHLNWRQAEKELKRAIELNPNYASAYQWYASTLAVMGRRDDMVRDARRAQELDPLSPIINAFLGHVYILARRYDDAVQQCRRTLEVDPGFPVAHLYLGMAYSQKGRHEEAIAEVQKSINLSQGSPVMVAALGYTYAAAGKKGEALRVLQELLEPAKRKFVLSVDVAIIYAAMGERDPAFQWLDKALEDGSLGSASLKLDPILDGLRGDPRFADLLRRTGLPAD